MVKAMNSRIEVNKFELQSRYYFHFFFFFGGARGVMVIVVEN